jgi:hypothetical protein
MTTARMYSNTVYLTELEDGTFQVKWANCIFTPTDFCKALQIAYKIAYQAGQPEKKIHYEFQKIDWEKVLTNN